MTDPVKITDSVTRMLGEAGGAQKAAPDVVTAHWTSVSHVGRFRMGNEDALLCLPTEPGKRPEHTAAGRTETSDHDLVIAVSDGMGGAQAGDRASALTVAAVADAVASTVRTAAAGFQPDYPGLLDNIAHSAHTTINAEAAASPEHAGMGATLSIAWLTPGRLWFAHVGDSRIYRSRGGELVQLTQDHSRVGHLQRSGIINERQARDHPRRHVLKQALGAGIQLIEPQLGNTDALAGDSFLVCSDGLTAGLWDKHIAAALAEVGPENLLRVQEKLLQDSLAASGRDNITFALLHLI